MLRNKPGSGTEFNQFVQNQHHRQTLEKIKHRGNQNVSSLAPSRKDSPEHKFATATARSKSVTKTYWLKEDKSKGTKLRNKDYLVA